MLKKCLLTLCLCLPGVVLASAGEERSTVDAAEQLSQQFASMENVRGQFVQKILDEQGNLLQEARGELAVKRPRHFYWKTLQPYEHLLVAKGDTIWLYDIDLEQITRQPFSEQLDQAPALILSGEVESLTAFYTIRLASPEQQQRVFTLTPNQEGGVFSKLILRFQADKLITMTLVDSFEQQTHIEFSELAYNTDIPPALFEFTPPPGIDVISNE